MNFLSLDLGTEPGLSHLHAKYHLHSNMSIDVYDILYDNGY